MELFRSNSSPLLFNQGTDIHLPRNFHEVRSKIRQAVEALNTDSIEDIANYIGKSVQRTKKVINAFTSCDMARLDDPIQGHRDPENPPTLEAVLTDETPDAPTTLCHNDDINTLNQMLARLEPRDSLIVQMRKGINGHRKHRLREIGDILGITKERTRQLEVRAYKTLKYMASWPSFRDAYAGDATTRHPLT